MKSCATMARERASKRRSSSAGLEKNPGFGGLRATRVPRRGRKSTAGLEGYSNGGGS